MKRRLTLNAERLTDLTEAELRLAGGAGGYDDTWTGQVGCVLSIGRCVTNQFCSLLCIKTEVS